MTRLLPVVTLAALAVMAAPPYRNPVVGNPHRVTESVADPQVLKFNGEYYLYATGNPVVAWHSKDLVHWQRIGPVFSGGAAGAWNAADLWAPECVYRNGKFYLYYCATQRSGDWRVGEMARRVGVATADSPRGPFVDSGAPMTPDWAIDAHVFLDPDDGREYLFYSYLAGPEGAGIVADRMMGPRGVAGNPSRVARGSEPWEDKDGDPSNGSVRYTNEAPTVLKRGGRYYLMYSGGSWDLPSYSLAYAVSDAPPEGGVEGAGWSKVLPPILRSSRQVEGPGHNAVVKAPDNVDDISFYHARVVPFSSPGDRITFADRLYWEHGRMRMDQPSLADLAAPAQPLFRDLFDRAASPLGPAWKTEGSWAIGSEEAVAEGAARAWPRTAALSHYVFEANIRGTGGVVAYSDGRNELRARIDARSGALVVERNADVIARSVLPAGFRVENWHQLLVTRNGASYGFALDGVHALSAQAPGLDGPTVPGLLASAGRTAFDGIALTSWFEDSFDAPRMDWSVNGGTWLTGQRALQQVAGGSGLFTAVKGDPAAAFELTAGIRWDDNDSTTSLAGIAAVAGDEMILGGFTRDIWPQARFTVERISGGKVIDTRRVVLPRGFRYDDWHTLRLVRNGGAFSFYLDGQLTLAAAFDIPPARAGLFTRGVRAAFDDCAFKRTPGDGNLILDGSMESLAWEEGERANAWEFTGGARGEYCCAYTGNRRLAIRDGQGAASQRIPGLAPGKYTVNAFIETSGDGSATLAVETASGRKQAAATGPWHSVSLEFEVAQPGAPVTVTFRGSARDGLAAADDFYLYRGGNQ